MGGFLSALGGFGQGALQYGSQIREQLERRREQYANLLTNLASKESDPAMRIQHLQTAADLLAGKDMGKVVPPYLKTVQSHMENTQALHDALPPQRPVPKTLPPGPAQPGRVPGMPQIEPVIGQDQPHPALGAMESLLIGQGGGAEGGQQDQPPSPPAPPAAQPQSSPVQGGKQIQLPSQVQSQAQSAPAAPAGGIPSLPGLPGLPTPENPADITSGITSNPLWQAEANRPALMQELQQRLSHQEQLRSTLESQQATLAYKQEALRQLKQSGEWERLPDIMKAQIMAGAYGLSVPSPGVGMMTPKLISSGTMGKDAPEGTLEYGTQNPIKPGSRYRVMLQPMTGETIWQPETDQNVMTQTAGGGMQLVNRNAPGVVPGAVAPTLNALHAAPTASGGVELYSGSGVKSGASPMLVPGAVTPAMLPSVNTVSTPGSLPTTTVKTKGGAGRAAGAGAGSGGGGSSSGSSNPAAVPSTVQGYMDDVKAGRTTLQQVPQKERNAVRQAMNQQGVNPPDILSATAQKSLATVDPVIKQVDDVLHKLDSIPSDAHLAMEYIKYKNGFSSKYNDLFTNLSFEGLRSGAAALQGMNSRAYPIIKRALDHTPNLDRLHGMNPDDVPLIKDKLNTIKGILQDAKATILQDEQKSGVIKPPDTGTSTGQTVDLERGPDGKLRIKR